MLATLKSQATQTATAKGHRLEAWRNPAIAYSDDFAITYCHRCGREVCAKGDECSGRALEFECDAAPMWGELARA